jgi:hypothetical protein
MLWIPAFPAEMAVGSAMTTGHSLARDPRPKRFSAAGAR